VKICVVGPSYPLRGGIAHYTSLLCGALGERGHEVKLISFKRLYPGFLFPGKTQNDLSGAPISCESEPLIDSMNPFTWFAAGRGARAFGPDLVIAQWWHPFFAPVLAAVAKRCRSVSKVMFLCHNVVPHENGGMSSRFLTRMALRHGDCFIVHSEEDLRGLLAMIPEADVVKSPHPTYAVFNSGTWERDECRRRLGVSGNVILFFGLVRRYKGLMCLIRAMPAVLSKIDATLLIVGEFYDDKSQYLHEICRLRIEDKTVAIDQYVPNEDVGGYFTAADVVALPYVSATQSGVVQIAFGFRKPVITTSVGGLPEAVSDGETGFVTPPEDPAALAEAIVKYFQESRAEEFAGNIERKLSEFSWGRMVDLVEGFAARGGD